MSSGEWIKSQLEQFQNLGRLLWVTDSTVVAGIVVTTTVWTLVQFHGKGVILQNDNNCRGMHSKWCGEQHKERTRTQIRMCEEIYGKDTRSSLQQWRRNSHLDT